jgi:hypothetical protein
MSKSISDMTLTDNWNLPQVQVRQKIMDLQEACLQMPQVDTPVREFFSDGCYGREIFIPKGTCLVGEIHSTEWIIVVSRGKIRVVSEEGISIIDATEQPVTFISPAGVKRAGHALEDTWWTGFRVVGDLTTTEEIRKAHLVDSYEALEDKTCGQ